MVPEGQENRPSLRELLDLAVHQSFVNFYDGGFIDHDWISIDGKGGQAISQIVERFNEYGLRQVNEAFAPEFEDQLDKWVKSLTFQFEQLKKPLNREPYHKSEPAYQSLVAAGNIENIVTMEDNARLEKQLFAFKTALTQFKANEPIAVYLNSGCEIKVSNSGYISRFPQKNAQVTVLQKPKQI